MTDPYPETANRMNAVEHLEELRRRILICLGIFLAASVLFFAKSDWLIRIAKKPLEGTASNLIYIAPTEAFLAFFKIAFLAGLIATFPFILYHAWRFLAPAVSKTLQRNILAWLGFALILFVCGILFSYFLALPFALSYLLNFGREWLIPQITIGKYISFFSALILVGGIIFEIPVVIGLLTDLGILKSEVLKQKRRYAFLGVLIFAAVITPTQDIFNMLLFALPMALLYEVGILTARRIEFRKKNLKLSEAETVV